MIEVLFVTAVINIISMVGLMVLAFFAKSMPVLSSFKLIANETNRIYLVVDGCRLPRVQ